MKKVVWTLNINNYEPEITRLTYPLLERYAKKIGAEFKIITERKFPEYSVTYEKLQIYELGKENDWNIFIDSDTFVNPDFFDLTAIIPKNYVLFTDKDFSPVRFKPDQYFIEDGRFIGACNWFSISSNETHNLWKPVDDLSVEEINNNIFPTVRERKMIHLESEHLQDDYILSRNISKYKLNHITYRELINSGRIWGNMELLFHNYELSPRDKYNRIEELYKLTV
jgi:hypothetical protein